MRATQANERTGARRGPRPTPAKVRPKRARWAVAHIPRLAHRGGPALREVEARLDELARDLGPFASTVHRDPRFPGVLVLAPGDRAELYGGLRTWAKTVRAYLLGRGFGASVVVGFDPCCAAAVASTRVGVAVFASPSEERARALTVTARAG